MSFNNGFGVPAPPFDTPYYAGVTNIATAVLFAIVAIWMIVGLLDYRKSNSPILLAFAFSGFACDLVEPYLDVMGGCLWPTSPTLTIFTILGRPMSLFSLSAWAAFGASMTCISYLLIRKVLEERKATGWLWLTFVLAGLVDVFFEEIMLNAHLYVYYANQPLILLTRFPWYYATLNGGGLFMAAAVVYRYKAYFRDLRALFLLLLVPMFEGANYGFTAMPVWIVVNGQYGWLTTQAGGLLTVILGFAVMAGTFQLVLQRNPFDLISFRATVTEDPGRN